MKQSAFLSTILLFAFMACGKDENSRMPDASYQPEITPARFPHPTEITNPYFPAPEGKKYTYEGTSSDGMERVEEQRLNITRTIQGIECIIVNFRAYVNDILIEEAYDWYAQDVDGTVWYFGEDVNNYKEDGTLDNTDGSWEAGVDGAKAGITMPANPTLGFKYREEYYFDEAEDQAEITGLNLDISIPFGNFSNCISTQNWTELEPDIIEHKFYAPGIGVIKETSASENEEIILTSIQ